MFVNNQFQCYYIVHCKMYSMFLSLYVCFLFVFYLFVSTYLLYSFSLFNLNFHINVHPSFFLTEPSTHFLRPSNLCFIFINVFFLLIFWHVTFFVVLLFEIFLCLTIFTFQLSMVFSDYYTHEFAWFHASMFYVSMFWK